VTDTRPGSSAQLYLDGMRLAVDEVNAAGGVAGNQLALSIEATGGSLSGSTDALKKQLQAGSPALLYVGTGPGVTPLRSDLERTGTPVFLLGGDLYTSHGLFRELFQTTIPWTWQAHVIGRYLVLDRKARSIAFAGFGPEAKAAADAAQASVEYWGGKVSITTLRDEGSDPEPAVSRVRDADAVIVFGSPEDSARMVQALATLPHPPRISGSAALLDVSPQTLGAPPGTTACYSYTWAGWAQPIKRVGRFTSAFQQAFGHPPVGLEQEGYDAVRALAAALGRTKGKGGPALVAALEAVHQTFSSFPVDLGPDDHMFLPRDQLGLFAVPGPNERLDPWQQAGSSAWRALMRTFTYDGTRTNVADADRRVFFPFWRKFLPGPEYWRSQYGIITKPTQDRIH
jgi:branched-chain amino acid transport system substrate-binding protein